MLKKLRNKKTAKKIWIILCILILPAFVFWGLGGALRNQKQSYYIAKFANLKISSLEYQDSLEAVKNQAIIQFGDKFSSLQSQLNLEAQALERLILLNEAKRRKINTSDQEVVELIESYPFFKNSKNQFDQYLYSQMLQYVFRTQPRMFEEEARQNIALAKLFNAVTDKVSLNDEETKEEYRKLNEEISIDYIAAIPSDFIKDLNSSEGEIKDYFAKNSIEFKEPITFNLDYIRLENEQSLNKLIPRLNKKEPFEKVAKAFNLEVKETGPLTQTDPIPGIGWSQEIFNLLFKAKVGDIIPPVHTDKYYYILRLKEKKEAGIPDFEKIKEKVKKVYLEGQQKKLAKEKIEEALLKLKENAGLKKTANELGLKAEATGPFKYGSYIEGIGASDNFWLTASGLKDQELSGIINEANGFYIIKLKSRLAMDEGKFAEEKAEFSAKLLLDKKQDYFLEFVKGLKKKTGIF